MPDPTNSNAPLHGIVVSFCNQDNHYQREFFTIYAEGFTEHTATHLIQLDLYGVVNRRQAEKFGQSDLDYRRDTGYMGSELGGGLYPDGIVQIIDT